MLPKSDTIRCCNRHTDYPVPVLSTVKFFKSEWWCPHCGAKYELFDGFKYYPIAYKLQLRREFFERLSLDYLSDKTEEYQYYQRPDQIVTLWYDADIALACYNLGFRHKPEDIVAGAVLYTIEPRAKRIDIVDEDGVLMMVNHEGRKAPTIDVKKYDWALLPSVQTTADILTRAMS